jgi:signal transduction histidine kinase
MLSTILHNLIGNAIKYTDRGGILIGLPSPRSRVVDRDL